MEIWLAVISAVVALGGGFLAVLRIRETNRIREITDRVAALEEENRRYSELIGSLQRQNNLLRVENASLIRLLRKYEEATREALIVVDENGIVVEWDAAAVLMFGYHADEAVGKDVSELIVPREIRQQHRYALANVFKYKRQPRTVPLKTQALNKDEEKFDVEVQLFPGWETDDATNTWRYGARIRKLVLPSSEVMESDDTLP